MGITRTHEFEYEGKKYTFNEMEIEDLQGMKNPKKEDLETNDIESLLPSLRYFAKVLTKTSVDKIDFTKWRPFEFLYFYTASTKFVLCELMGGKMPGEQKMDLTQIQKDMIQKK